jgi:hypothetical protein
MSCTGAQLRVSFKFGDVRNWSLSWRVDEFYLAIEHSSTFDLRIFRQSLNQVGVSTVWRLNCRRKFIPVLGV